MAHEQAKLEKQVSSGSSTQFDATKNIRLVISWCSWLSIDKYFLHLKKIAESLSGLSMKC